VHDIELALRHPTEHDRKNSREQANDDCLSLQNIEEKTIMQNTFLKSFISQGLYS